MVSGFYQEIGRIGASERLNGFLLNVVVAQWSCSRRVWFVWV